MNLIAYNLPVMLSEAKESTPIYVTSVVDRIPQFRGGYTMRIPRTDEKGESLTEWWQQFGGRIQFTFPAGPEGRTLFNRLMRTVRGRDATSVPDLLAEIEMHRIPNYDERSEVTRWGDMAVQLPGDWGPIGENRDILRNSITARARGRVLEAMSGYNSYFEDSPSITEVVALDYCREALERYDHPERTRILYNLERVGEEAMDFFTDRYFDTAGVFFGVNYLTIPQAVYKEFGRILSPSGQLLIVGGTHAGYRDLQKRPFVPAEVVTDLQAVGFSASSELLPYKTRWQVGDYYLVTGTKTEN